MSDVQELLEAIQAAGVTIQSNGTNLVIQPASRVPADLKQRLRERKTEILRWLEVEIQLVRLGISIAIDNGTGVPVLIFSKSDAEAVKYVAVVYKPFNVKFDSEAQRRQVAADLEYYEGLLRRRRIW